jgi:hypothetical protein
MYRLLYSIPIWVAMFLLMTLVSLLGLVLIPVAVLFQAYIATGPGEYGHDKYAFTWPFMNLLYGNYTDGIAAGWQYKNMGSVPLQILYWSAIRNSANGLRTAPYLSCRIDPSRVRFKGSITSDDGSRLLTPYGVEQTRRYDRKPYEDQWYFAWQGLYSCIYVVRNWGPFGRRRLWVGFKLFPTDIFGLKPTDYRARGAGFARQWRRLDDPNKT